MAGISHLVNLLATLGNMRRNSPIAGVDKHLFKQIIMSIITGSIRANDKRLLAGETQDDTCGLCNGARQTAEHLFWDCPHSDATRAFFLKIGRRIRGALEMNNPGAAAEFRAVTECAAWKCCGIASDALGAVRDYGRRPSPEFATATPRSEQLIRHDSIGATAFLCPDSGKTLGR